MSGIGNYYTSEKDNKTENLRYLICAYDKTCKMSSLKQIQIFIEMGSELIISKEKPCAVDVGSGPETQLVVYIPKGKSKKMKLLFQKWKTLLIQSRKN